MSFYITNHKDYRNEDAKNKYLHQCDVVIGNHTTKLKGVSYGDACNHLEFETRRLVADTSSDEALALLRTKNFRVLFNGETIAMCKISHAKKLLK